MNPQIFRLFLPCLCACLVINSSSYGQSTSGPRTLENLIEDGQGGSGGDGTKPATKPASPSKSSSAVRQILDKASSEVKKNREAFEKAVETNRKDYDKANEKPLGEAKRELQDLAKKLIEDGKTDEATAVLAQVKTLEEDVMRMAGAGGQVQQKPLLERMAGRWNRSNDPSYWVIERDGRAGCRNLQTHKPCHRDSEVRIVDEETAEIMWPGGWKWLIKMAGNDVLAVHETENGKVHADGLILTRQK